MVAVVSAVAVTPWLHIKECDRFVGLSTRRNAHFGVFTFGVGDGDALLGNILLTPSIPVVSKPVWWGLPVKSQRAAPR